MNTDTFTNTGGLDPQTPVLKVSGRNSFTNTSIDMLESALHNRLTEDGILFEVPYVGVTKFLLVNDIGEYFEKHDSHLDTLPEAIIITIFEFKGKVYYIDWVDIIYDTKTFQSIGVWDHTIKDITFT